MSNKDSTSDVRLAWHASRRHAGFAHGTFIVRMWSLLAVMAAICLTATSAIAQPATAQPASEAAAWNQLEALLKAAPSRAVGQPGNETVDRMIRDRFEQAVAANNDPRQLTDAMQAIAKSDAASEAFSQARQAAMVVPEAQAGTTGSSAAMLRSILKSPGPLTLALALLTGLVVFTWRQQKRRSLLVVGTVLALLTISVPITAWLGSSWVHEDEKPGSTGTQAGLEARANEAAINAWKADSDAAKAARGLWQAGRIVYPTAVFKPGAAQLTVGGQTVPLYPFLPNLVDPGNLPEAGFTGPLVSIGKGGPEELTRAGKSIQGSAVLIEFSSERHWLDAVQLGAKVVIVVEPPGNAAMTMTEAALKKTETPLNVPRFFVRRADLQKVLGGAAVPGMESESSASAAAPSTTQVTITREPGRWERQEVATDWLLVPGSEKKADGTPSDATPVLMHLQAYKDSNSAVPSLAPGAQSAANLVLILRLVDHFEKHPPRVPVLISVVNDHANALLGEHEFAHFAFGDAASVVNELRQNVNSIESALARARFIQEEYSKPINAQRVEEIRNTERKIAAELLPVKKIVQDKLSLMRNLAREDRKALQMKLDADKSAKEGQPRLTSQQRTDIEAEIDRLDRYAVVTNDVSKLFNKFGRPVKYDDLSAEHHQRLAEVCREISETAGRDAVELEKARKRYLANLSLRRRLLWLQSPVKDADADDIDSVLAAEYRPLPATMFLGFDLAFGNDHVGLFHVGNFRSEDASDTTPNLERVRLLAKETIQVANDYARSTGKPNLLTDTVRGAGGLPWTTYLGGKFALATDVTYPYRVPAMALTSVRDSRPYAFTPSDTIDRIDRGKFDAIMSFVEAYIPRLIDWHEIPNTVRAAQGNFQPLTVAVDVKRHDQFAVQVPQTPLPGAIVTVSPALQKLPNNAMTLGQVRPFYVGIADSRGALTIRGAAFRNAAPQVFAYDKDFRHLTDALDWGDWEKRIGSTFSAANTTYYLTRVLVAAAFEKVDLIGLTQPLTLTPLASVSIIDAGQDSAPTHFGASGVKADPIARAVPLSLDGTGSIFVEKRTLFKLKTGSGIVLNVDPNGTPEEREKGRGFQPTIGRLPNVVLQSAQDMTNLTTVRLDKLTARGVKNETADLYNNEAAAAIEVAKTAAEKGHNTQALNAAEVARGLSFRGYDRGKASINDLTKAVVIFLALVIPFCVFITKLTSPFTDVNRNLAMFAAVFTIMALVLRFVHPAFQVAETPEVVILAFIILGLAGFVATVLIGRFNTSMTQAVEESQLTESVEAPQSRLAGVAFIVGVNNMKRRRIRTSLTTATIILVTFTMLSVISVGQDIEPTVVRIGPGTPYSGFVFTRSGLSAIDPVQMTRLRAHYEGKATVVARAWTQRLGVFGEYLGYDLVPTKQVVGAAVPHLGAKVLVGMEVNEDGLISRMPITIGRWFSSNAASEIILSESAASLLGISKSNFTLENGEPRRIRVQGREVDLVGLLDDAALAKMRDLSDIPLLPMLSQATQANAEKANQTLSAQEAAGTAVLEGGSLLGVGTSIARTVDVAFVPIEFARSFGEADYRTLSVKFESNDQRSAETAASQAWQEAKSLIQFQQALVSVGLSDAITDGGASDTQRKVEAGQYTMASSTSTQVGGVLKIAIPIILAATIILNTMLGSVMERRREVAIYNAIGLNPGHVMVFFLAESLVFGLVGSVAGYLIGQTLSLIITHFNLIKDLNLNYSSLSVVLVIFLTIGTVLLSTIYPAMMAARAAVPSGQRRWSLPQPIGNEIYVQFPFSYDGSRVLGVCAYLRDYMKQNSEASTGQFLAKVGAVGRVPAPAGHALADGHDKAYCMIFDIAPAPFDLGVNQKMEVYAYFDPLVKSHMLAVHLTRLSGEMGNWVAVNQPFLESLRKRLLGWRSQKAATQEAYFHEGEQMFADAGNLPVAGDSPDAAASAGGNA